VSGVPELSGLLHIRDESRKDPGRCPGFPAGESFREREPFIRQNRKQKSRPSAAQTTREAHECDTKDKKK